MAKELDKIKYRGEVYEIRDSNAQTSVSTINTSINNINTSINNINNEISGVKTSITGVNTEISNMKTNFQAGCDTIAAAVTAMGVTTAANSSPTVIAANIKKINTTPTMTGNALAENVLTGKTFYTTSANLKHTGTMTNRSVVNSSIGGINSSYPNLAVQVGDAPQIGTSTVDKVSRLCIRVPIGYYNGESYVGIPASTLGNTTTDKVLSGSTFSSQSGIGLSGTIPNRTNNTGTTNLSWAGDSSGNPISGSPYITTVGAQLRVRLPYGYYGSGSYLVLGDTVVSKTIEAPTDPNVPLPMEQKYYVSSYISGKNAYNAGKSEAGDSYNNIKSSTNITSGGKVSAYTDFSVSSSISISSSTYYPVQTPNIYASFFNSTPRTILLHVFLIGVFTNTPTLSGLEVRGVNTGGSVNEISTINNELINSNFYERWWQYTNSSGSTAYLDMYKLSYLITINQTSYTAFSGLSYFYVVATFKHNDSSSRRVTGGASVLVLT